MQFITSNIALYRFLIRQLNERTPKLFIDREYADIANFIVFSRLEQGVVHAADIPQCREYNSDTTEKVEISEGVMLLSKAVFEKVYKDGWADVAIGIYALFGILGFWDREYFEHWPTQKNLWIESKCEFEREYDARVRVMLLP
jgi:hypothetical protein